jgi:hypothetical protein
VAQRAATIQEVRDRLGPAFVDPPITDAIVQMALDDTACFVDPSAFGACASTAHAYAAAHCVAGSPYAASIALPEGFGALVTAHSNGPASRSFAVPKLADDAGAWGLTYWGRKYLEFRASRWGKGSAVLARTPGLTGSRPRCW